MYQSKGDRCIYRKIKPSTRVAGRLNLGSTLLPIVRAQPGANCRISDCEMGPSTNAVNPAPLTKSQLCKGNCSVRLRIREALAFLQTWMIGSIAIRATGASSSAGKRELDEATITS
ncbi:hypothetical protein D3C72_1688600 [compost metagenome]